MIKGILLVGLAVIVGMWTATTALKTDNSNLTSVAGALNHTFAKATTTRPNVSTASSISANTDPSSSNSSTNISDETSNWAGYVATGGTYTAISGSWTVPSVSDSTDDLAADASWIGIGGVSTDDLIQVGTQNLVQDGQVTNGSFYEELPDSSETIPTVTVSPGDTITASIQESEGGEWLITIKDITNGESFSNTVYYDSSESSAEWIEEAPSEDGSNIIPLDQFGSVSFTNGSVADNNTNESIEGSGAKAINMESSAGEALTDVSSLTNGNSFSVTRTNADDSDDTSSAYSPGGFGHRLFRIDE
jgi:hypothetical protein